MVAFRRWRTFATVGVGLLALTTNGWGKQQPPVPPVPATPTIPPGIPGIPSPPPPAPPAPLSTLKGVTNPPLPPVPAVTPPGPGVIPLPNPQLQFPSIPEAPRLPPPPPAPPAPVPESGILEPVVTVHRFAGKYLGGDQRRLLTYIETGDGKAEIQSRPFAEAIPNADVKANDDVKRIEVPAGKVAQYDSRVFLMTPRELLVVNVNCEIDWRFTLPGKPDNGEKLLVVAGFQDGEVYLASQQDTRPGANDKPIGRVYAFDVVTGRQVGFATIADGFHSDAKLTMGPKGVIFSFRPLEIRAYEVATGRDFWRDGTLPQPMSHGTTNGNLVIATTATGIQVFRRGTPIPQTILGARGTAPAAINFDHSRGTGWAYLPIKTQEGANLLCGYNDIERFNKWSVPASQEITVAPVFQGTSVYFLGGKTLYRVNAETGAICWKNTLPLNPGEVLTELAFVGGELQASGPGVLVRIADRGEQPKAKPEVQNERPIVVPSIAPLVR